MPSDALDQEDYASSQDSDFVADDVSAHGSDTEDDATEDTLKKQRLDAELDHPDASYDNSGDEAIVRKGRKRQNRAHDKSGDSLALDGGEGGLIKTRRQRAEEKAERAAVANLGPVTIDVDAVWEQMISGKAPVPEAPAEDPNGNAQSLNADEKETNGQPDTASTPTIAEDDPDTICIKRTYNFAGRVHTEEKVVPRDSAEAKLYLASAASLADNDPPPRATRKAFRSAFDPYLDAGPGRTDLDLGLAARRQAAREAQAKKLNTVEKSRMDWAGFVDKEGIKDELEVASKSKGSYNAREAFLARSEAVRDEEARRARMATRM